MARPKADLPPADAIATLVDHTGRLALRVTPSARSEGVELSEGRVLVRVRARPTDGEATAAALALLARALGVAPSKLELLRGATSRDKLVRIAGWQK
jgi:uncharacterized protein YggU (UPF0235/DUF167 family)